MALFRAGAGKNAWLLIVFSFGNAWCLSAAADEKPRAVPPRGGLVIEATGKAPTLSDIPVEPYEYKPGRAHRDAEARESAKRILRTLGSPELILGLPPPTFDVGLDGLLPYVPPSQVDEGKGTPGEVE